MTLISSTKKEQSKAEIRFLIPSEQFEAEVTNVFKAKSKNIQIPGFRKGKAPRTMIEKMYGKSFFYEDAINNLLSGEYPLALEACPELEPVGRPEIDVESIDEKGVTILATVTVKPDVTLDDYKGIVASRSVSPVSEEEISAELKKIQERNSRTIDVTDRAAELGDTVTIDYSGSVDGVKFDGGTAENQKLELGSGSFIPGFEEQVVGHSIGESFDINVKFPDEYHAPELAGKEAVFSIVLHAVSKTELPDIDDDFAKDVSEFDTLDEYKADISAKIRNDKEKAADRDVENQIVSALIEKLHADIPEEMFDAETENLIRDYDNRLRMNGMDLKTYFKYTGMTLDTLRKQMRPEAEKQVRTRLALEKIVSLEDIKVSDEDIEKDYESLAKAYGLEIEKVKELVDKNDIGKDLAVSKALELVKSFAVITDGKNEESEKPKKTAKKTVKKAEAAPEGNATEEKPKRSTRKKTEEPKE